MPSRSSPARYAQSQAKFADCQVHGPGSGAELFLVEGDSALSSVLAVRDAQKQAVLTLQGKPLNAWRATPAKVAQHLLFQQLAQALGLAAATAWPEGQPAALRFDRVLLLFDPDADGIHIGALMVLYFHRWLPRLLESGALWLARAPMFELSLASTAAGSSPAAPSAAGPAAPPAPAPATPQYAYHPAQCAERVAALRAAAGGAEVRVRAFRGLGGLAPEALRSLCLEPSTRQAQALGPRDAQAVIEVFGQVG